MLRILEAWKRKVTLEREKIKSLEMECRELRIEVARLQGVLRENFSQLKKR